MFGACIPVLVCVDINWVILHLIKALQQRSQDFKEGRSLLYAALERTLLLGVWSALVCDIDRVILHLIQLGAPMFVCNIDWVILHLI